MECHWFICTCLSLGSNFDLTDHCTLIVLLSLSLFILMNSIKIQNTMLNQIFGFINIKYSIIHQLFL